MKYYLDFEEPIRLLDEEISSKESVSEPSKEVKKEIAKLHEKRLQQINKIHSSLSRWQHVQLARHPQRPYALDYINTIFTDFIEMHGDRLYADDPDNEYTNTGTQTFYPTITSTGFSYPSTVTHNKWNASGMTYIYMAFAESPFKTSNAR